MDRLRGKCQKEISKVMAPFKGMPIELANALEKEYKINVGDVISIYNEKENDSYYFYLNHHRIEMNREEVEEHFEIVWEYGCYNTCIRDGVLCQNIGHHVPEGTTSRDKYVFNCCKIGWEIGRGDCYRFE